MADPAAPPPSVDAVLTDAARYLQDVRTCDAFEADDPHHHPDGECRNCGWFKPDHLITDLSRLLGSQTWQPIETAPPVGWFLLARVGIPCPVIAWRDSSKPSGWEYERGDVWFTPTHWMPLPPPPAPSGGPHD